MKSCYNCGEEISDNSSKFCPKCGVELEIKSTNQKENKSDDLNELKNDNVNKLVDSASNAINQVVTQAKIEKNYIKYRMDENDGAQVKGDKFILSEKIANTIDNITNEKEKNVKKTKIEIEDETENKE